MVNDNKFGIKKWNGLRGMKPYRRNSIKLRFGDILRQSKLPPLPSGKWFGHLSEHEPFAWGMLANDQAGCCVISGAEHETMIWDHATRKPVASFTDPGTLSNYSMALVAEGGLPYNANDQSTDTGLDPTMAAEWRRTVGLADASGKRHTIDAYAEIGTWEEALYAVHLFGVCGLCFQLPDSAEDQFNRGQRWDDVTGAPGGGHYVPAGSLNSNGDVVVITWGQTQGITKAYIGKYCDGMIAYISREYMEATGKSPEAIDWAMLQDYLGELKTV